MKTVITGGAGFIGSNCAEYFTNLGHSIVIFDNLSRKGSRLNLDWLRERFGTAIGFFEGDVRDFETLSSVIRGADAVIHLASQVAVTTSVSEPREDFEINALGTFNVLEAVRLHAPDAAVINASSNKVYGALESVRLLEEPTRYKYADFIHGIPESFPLDFHSPYGCSKGAGDQYTIDYARIYGLRSVSLRQSCIYGPRQFGVEDQGWLAHFMISAILGKPIVIYGDGRQVRDVLHINDLLRAYETAITNIDRVKGGAVNLGGGPDNTLSIWKEFGEILADLHGSPLQVTFEPWRPGDQRVFVSDIKRADTLLGWKPQIGLNEGLLMLYRWISENRHLFGDEA